MKFQRSQLRAYAIRPYEIAEIEYRSCRGDMAIHPFCRYFITTLTDSVRSHSLYRNMHRHHVLQHHIRGRPELKRGD